MDSFWVASRWGGEILLAEVLLRPGKVFTLDSGILHTSQDGKTVGLGTLLGFSSDFEALKQSLGLGPDAIIHVVPARG